MIAQLDTKTVYSFMESVVSIEKYVQMAKEYGYSHLAIMDVDNLYGAYHFLEATRKHGIQPLIGLEMTLEHFDIIFTITKSHDLFRCQIPALE